MAFLNIKPLVISSLIFLFIECLADESNWDDKWQSMCPALYPRIFVSYTPRGNLTYGVYTKKPYAMGMKQCVASCCSIEKCNVALVYNNTCYHVQCKISNMCTPLYRPELVNLEDPPSMVLVNPIENGVSWSDIFDQMESESHPSLIDNLNGDNTIFDMTTCAHITDCPVNQVCIKQDGKTDIGICNDINSAVDFSIDSNPKLDIIKETSNAPITKMIMKQLIVSAVSKELRLPDNHVTLSAFTVPAESGTEHYNYAWSILSQPDGHTGTMTDQNKSTVKLSNLSEGLYKFRVDVNSPTAYGVAYANVSVLPPKRINRPPIAIISPSSQIVKLPNTGAVLDGSSSTDDDQVIGYHWELQQGPIGYQPNLVNTPTLQLDKLIAGNYTFKLTVEDSNHITNFTTANITVLKLTDYPPSANAGSDIIVYLPQNTITLNGNLSTDDRGIASWEWTKSPSDENKAVDMQNTRTPYLQLSNLEEGIYTFVLKVTDDSEQSSTAEVRVFVKPPTNKPPNANAGEDITVSLPNTKVLLNGSNSRDDIKIVSYYWELLNGPNKVEFSAFNNSITNVTKLTKGIYTFKLTVIDDNGNKDSDIVKVEVTQNSNAPPIANAGGDQIIVAPITALIINGSQSTDDLRINQWLWTRDPSSIAIGTIINGTEHSPILVVTDIIPGRYVFKLKVTDEQGLSSEDTVSVIVKPDPQLTHLVELTLNVDAHQLTESQKNSFINKLQMLLHDEASIVVRNLKIEQHTGRACLVFYVQQKGQKSLIPGIEVVHRLKSKLKQDSGLLQFSVMSMDTAICQNNCSGHGICDEESRQCLCEAFWMQNLIEKYFGYGESNCDWSILYVIIALMSLLVCGIGLVWGFFYLCQKMCIGRRRSRLKKKTRYSLLQSDIHDEDDCSPFSVHKTALSESDTESDDVLYEHKRIKINNEHIRNGKNVKNGFIKNGSRIKA